MAKTKTTKSKQGTIRMRKSNVVPAQIQQRSGSRRQLLNLLGDRELGWCTTDSMLYIKIGKALRPIATSGISGLDVVGTTNQVEVKKSTVGKEVRYTISLADVIVDAQVPPPPVPGKVLTSVDEGAFEWKDPTVYEILTEDIDE